MKRIKKSWMAVLLGAVLMVTLVGVVWAGPNARPRATVSTHKLTIPAAAFNPAHYAHAYDNWGFALWSKDSDPVFFIAHVAFPHTWKVTVEKIELIGYDKNVNARICASLYRTRPAGPDEDKMGAVCSGKSFSSSTDPRVWTDSTIAYNPIGPRNGAYIWLEFSRETNLRVYAVRIFYHKGT